MKDKPFVLLGVNSDSKKDLRAAMKREKITWRSWWDGGGADGPIAKQWNVSGWPTVYLLDHKGVIRPIEGKLDEAVDKLLAELAAEKKTP